MEEEIKDLKMKLRVSESKAIFFDAMTIEQKRIIDEKKKQINWLCGFIVAYTITTLTIIGYLI